MRQQNKRRKVATKKIDDDKLPYLANYRDVKSHHVDLTIDESYELDDLEDVIISNRKEEDRLRKIITKKIVNRLKLDIDKIHTLTTFGDKLFYTIEKETK